MSSEARLEDRKALPVWMGLQQKVPVGNPALEVLRELATSEQLRVLSGLLSQRDALHALEEALVGARLELRQITDALEGVLVDEGRHSHVAERVPLLEHHVVDLRVWQFVLIDVLPNVVEVPVVDRVKRCGVLPLGRPVHSLATYLHRVLRPSASPIDRLAVRAKTNQERGAWVCALVVLDGIVESEPLVLVTNCLRRVVPWAMFDGVWPLPSHPQLVLAGLPANELPLGGGCGVG